MLQIVGPAGVVFHAATSCPDIWLWGLTAAQIAAFLWPRIAGYVLDTIDKLTNPPAPVQSPSLLVPLVFQ